MRKGSRVESPIHSWETTSDEARYRDRPSREDERGAGSPLPRRGARVLDEPGTGAWRGTPPGRDLSRYAGGGGADREGPLRDRGLRRLRRRDDRSALLRRPDRRGG